MDQEKKTSKGFADKIARGIILGLVVLMPLFFIPSAYVAFPFAKAFLLYCVVIVAFCIWIVSRLRDGKILFPKVYFFVALGGVVLAYGLATLFSASKATSFFGQGFEVETFAFIFTLAILTFLTTYLFSSKKSITYAYLAFFISFPIIALFQLLRLLFGPGFLTLGIFTSAVGSLVGGWNDLAIYCGLAALFSFLTLELLPLEKWLRKVFIGILVVSLFLLSVINFSIVWYILGIMALIFFVYNFSFNRSKSKGDSSKNSIPITSLVVIIISFIFILFRGNIYNTLSTEPLNLHILNRFAISNVEVRPSVGTTFTIARHELAKSPIFGIGPNRFASAWTLWKPSDVNNTVFWATDFTFGSGLIPTAFTTTGILGVLAWIAFFVFFLYTGFKILFRRADPLSRYFVTSSFIVSFYLWIFAILYIPSATILMLTFFFTGIFFASLIDENLIEQYTLDFVKDPRVSFFAVLAFIIILLGTVVYGYTVVRKFTSAFYFNKALVLSNTSTDVTTIQSLINKAIRFDDRDQYYRALSSIDLAQLNSLVANQKNISQDSLQTQFRALVGDAEATTNQAIILDKTNYQNWLASAAVYDFLVQLGNTDAYTHASDAYKQALVLDPTNPSIILSQARLEMDNKNTAGAKDLVIKALQLKGNYVDAIFALSQIQAGEGDLKSAIQSVEAAATVTPNDPNVYFELGLLRYDNKDYAGAISAFGQAVTLAPNYANAKYFLGLSYYYAGQTATAITTFQALKVSNPDATALTSILTNLQAGRDPFTNVAPPNNKPEKSSTPPVKDSSSKTTATSSQ